MRSIASFAATVALTAAVASAVCAADADPQVGVAIVNGEIRTEVSLFVSAPRALVWEVMTDFEHMPSFIRELQVSKIVSRGSDGVRVMQREVVRFGPFDVPVESVKDVKLAEPSRSESKLVSGSLRKYESVTELVPAAGGTRIIFHSNAIPDSALARLAGESFVRRQAEQRFREIRDEILRREQATAKTE